MRMLLVLTLCACGGGGATGWRAASALPSGSKGGICVLVDGDTVFVGHTAGLARSADDGATWTSVPVGPSVNPVEALNLNGGVMLAGADDATYASRDHGATWSTANTGLPDTASPYAFWNVGGVTLVGLNTGTPGGGVYRSADHGALWTSSSAGLDLRDAAVSFAQLGTTVFVAGPPSVGRSTDDGLSWQATGTTSNPLWLETLDSVLFVATASTGVFTSTDGVGFTSASAGLPGSDIVSTLFATGGKIYAGTDHHGVFVTPDKGKTWAAFSDGFGAEQPRVVQFALHGSRLIAVTELGGVWTRAL